MKMKRSRTTLMRPSQRSSNLIKQSDVVKSQFSLDELRDIKTIRMITKDSYKQLGDLLNDRKG